MKAQSSNDQGSTGSAGTSTEMALGAFADWAAALRFEDLSPDAILRLKQSVRDGLGCAAYGAELPWTSIVAEALAGQASGHGPATVWGTGAKVDLKASALANGTAIQSYELDDMHAEASLHGSSTMLPATLGLAESRGGVSGRDLITALAVGWEAAVRLNRCMGNILVNGWHPPTITGTFGAAAAAGRLVGLSTEEFYECLSLALLQASGLTAVQYGGMAKRFYAGRAAEIGVQSALLAASGFTSPDDVLGQPVGGFLSSFAPDRHHDVGAFDRDLGAVLAAEGISFKLYSCCGASHPAIDLLAQAVAENPAVTVDNVSSIDVALSEHGFKHVGFPYVPGSAVTAQFSIVYCLAAYLLEGAVFVEQFRDELLADPRILEVIRRITTSADPALQDEKDLRTKRAVRLRISLNDGQVIERQGMLARGHAELPASEAELRDKFDRLVGTALSPDDAAHISEVTQQLDGVPDVAVLVSTFARAMESMRARH